MLSEPGIDRFYGLYGFIKLSKRWQSVQSR